MKPITDDDIEAGNYKGDPESDPPIVYVEDKVFTLKEKDYKTIVSELRRLKDVSRFTYRITTIEDTLKKGWLHGSGNSRPIIT